MEILRYVIKYMLKDIRYKVYVLQKSRCFFPARVLVFPAGILQILHEILTKTLIIEQIQFVLRILREERK